MHLVANGRVLGEDGNAALALEIIAVHDALVHLLVIAEYLRFVRETTFVRESWAAEAAGALPQRLACAEETRLSVPTRQGTQNHAALPTAARS